MATTTTAPTLKYSDLDGEHSFALMAECTSIGRSPDQDLVLKEAFVSRRHALITRQDGKFEVVDQNSSHGTFLNGQRVQRVTLKPGDCLQFGSLNAASFRFLLPSGVPESSSGLASGLLSALSVFAPTDKNIPQPAREIEKLNFLLNAARQLNAGGAITDIFHALLQLSLQLTGVERGFVFLLEGEEMRLALGLRSDGSTVEEDSSVSRRAMQKAIESDSKFFLSDTLADDSASGWASVVANSIRSIYCIPLRKHISPAEPNRLLGMLYLDSQIGAGSLSDIDHRVLDTLANEASTLLHNALLAKTELKARQAADELAVAASIHSGLMSITLPRLDYAELRARSLPCHAIGGDFYDAIVLDDSLCVVIADVSGKGVPASIVAATLQGIIHALLLTGQSLTQIADLVNRFLCTRQVGKYATMVVLRVFPNGCVEYMNCGHIPPLLVTPKGTHYLEEANLIVGIIAEATYTSSQVTLRPGDRILLTTDGITEIENKAGEQIGIEGLAGLAHLPGLDAVIAHLIKVQASAEAQDDWTLLDIQYTGR
ncbi:SpoIIE family protein phosphatase [Telmatobacter sp. DSM 110680]|uniref:SpoIIE family protein phosphatase n=1 Tax=Telmatobacter sp. DSM 110680 TaxID=3036704 RepID=A0AAU7DHD7_9BACT